MEAQVIDESEECFDGAAVAGIRCTLHDTAVGQEDEVVGCIGSVGYYCYEDVRGHNSPVHESSHGCGHGVDFVPANSGSVVEALENLGHVVDNAVGGIVHSFSHVVAAIVPGDTDPPDPV